MKQSRWKSKILWGAILAQVVVLLQIMGIWEQVGITSDTATNVFTGFLQILAIFGIVNDPTNPSGL